MKRTSGPFVVRKDHNYPFDWEIVKPVENSDVPWYVATLHGHPDDGDAECNARFVAEAFNVADETGLTPRQLADQRDALLAALESVMDRLVDRHENDEAAIQARAAIAKARGES